MSAPIFCGLSARAIEYADCISTETLIMGVVLPLSKEGDVIIYIDFTWILWGCPPGVMVKAMDCGIVVREFVLQSHYYVHFRANTLGKGMNPLILPAMG